MSKRNFHVPNEQMRAALEKAGLTSQDIAWYPHEHGRRFAPLPDCKLRRLAKKAGFTSSKDFLDAERKHHGMDQR